MGFEYFVVLESRYVIEWWRRVRRRDLGNVNSKVNFDNDGSCCSLENRI